MPGPAATRRARAPVDAALFVELATTKARSESRRDPRCHSLEAFRAAPADQRNHHRGGHDGDGRTREVSGRASEDSLHVAGAREMSIRAFSFFVAQTELDTTFTGPCPVEHELPDNFGRAVRRRRFS